jgi:hypothetical protein
MPSLIVIGQLVLEKIVFPIVALSKKSHAHLQCVHNSSAKFEECQLKGVGGDDYTK